LLIQDPQKIKIYRNLNQRLPIGVFTSFAEPIIVEEEVGGERPRYTYWGVLLPPASKARISSHVQYMGKSTSDSRYDSDMESFLRFKRPQSEQEFRTIEADLFVKSILTVPNKIGLFRKRELMLPR
jgi:hypothetical protein